jgi:hypothetical protein
MLSATADLLDVNVWLALAVAGHPHHDSAVKAWGEMNRPAFCRITQLGFLRLLCNRPVMGADTLGPDDAWSAYAQLLAGGVARFIEEPEGIEANLKYILKGATAGRDFWTDAYLAAFAKSAGMRLVSFDTGFARIKDLEHLILGRGKLS